jgi:hypothetical protein
MVAPLPVCIINAYIAGKSLTRSGFQRSGAALTKQELYLSMTQVFDPFNLIILAVAVIIFFRLRSVLGTRTGNEKPFDPFGGQNEAGTADDARSGNDNVVPLPGRGKPAPADTMASDLDDDDDETASRSGTDLLSRARQSHKELRSFTSRIRHSCRRNFWQALA